MAPTLPKIIALCGHPKSGKSLAAQFLADEFGYTLVDDGGFLREIAMAHFGLSLEDVTTQEGKAKEIVVNGVTMTVRELLGKLGNAFEDQFGANVIPEIALKRAQAGGPGPYVFGSVRREQGAYYKAQGGVVWHIDAPVPPSPHEFDTFNLDNVDHTINNPGPAGGFDALRSEIGRTLAVS